MKQKLLTLFTLLVLCVTGAWGDNGDVLFSQDFNSSTAVAYDAPSSGSKERLYNSESPLTNLVGTDDNLFTSIASHVKKGDIAINSTTGGNKVDATGIFQVYSNGDNENYWSLNRTSRFATIAPKALKVSMDIWFKNISSGSDTGVSFAVGDGFTDGLVSTSRQDASNVHSGFGIMDNSSATLTKYGDKSTVIASAITQSAWLSFVWIINNTGETLEYDNPTGSGTTELNNDCFDIWLKTQAGAVSTYTIVSHNIAATTAAKDLQNIYIGYNSSNKKKIEFRLDNVIVTDLTPSAAPAIPKTSTTTTISGGSGLNKDIKNGTLAGTLTANVTVTSGGATVDGATVTWSSTDTSIAEVNETTGEITLVAPGDVHITATYDGDETYAPSFDTYELNVEDSRAEITPSLTYDNTTLILGQTTTATPTLTGNTGNGDVTYSSDDTSVATVDADGVVTAVAVGTAHITANIAATSDYRAGSAQATITVANNPLGSKSITWKLSPINGDNAELTSTSESTSIYLKNIGEINHSKVSLNSSPSSAKNRTAKVDRTVGKDNDKYVYVTFDVEDGYYFIPSSISIKVANVSNVTTFDAELIDENDVTVGESEKTFNSTDGTVETWVINNSDNGKAMSGTVTLKIYGYAETAGTYRFGNQIVIEGNVTRVVPVTVSDAKYATFASDYDLDFSSVDGLYAYTATASSNTITFNKVTGSVKAGDGLLLYADVNTATTFNVPVATNSPSAVEGNKLVRGTGEAVSTDGTTSGSYNYVLSNNGGVIAFYYANGKTVDTNKAYLKDITASASKISLPFNDDETTAIDNITISQYDNDAPMYNMAGQRVSESYKGVVIQNGKKYIRK